jgi:hypothetical protein
MAISQAYTNSQTISTGEHSMPNDAGYSSGSPITVSGVYQAFVDLSAMAAGDEFELTVYEKISGSGSTQRVVYKKNFFGSCAMPIQVTPSLVLINGWDMTLKKIAGTDRSIEWSIRRAA